MTETITGINGSVSFDVHPCEPLGKISISGSGAHEFYGGAPGSRVFFRVESLRQIRRAISKILQEVELREKKEREDKKSWEKSST